MNCPNCSYKLHKNPKHAEGVWNCSNCEGVFHIVAMTKPLSPDEMKHRDQIKQSEIKLRQWKLGLDKTG